MALKLQLSSTQGSSVMYHHCHHTAEPIQLYKAMMGEYSIAQRLKNAKDALQPYEKYLD